MKKRVEKMRPQREAALAGSGFGQHFFEMHFGAVALKRVGATVSRVKGLSLAVTAKNQSGTTANPVSEQVLVLFFRRKYV